MVNLGISARRNVVPCRGVATGGMEEAGPLPPLFLRTNFVIVSKLTEEKL
jgi:hypothetical protein